jgi:hypothetical protein
MAIRNRTNRVCILGHEEAFHFASTGELPPHTTHHHCGRRLADQLTSDFLFVAEGQRVYAASWVGQGKRAITLHDLRRWKKLSTFGCGVMQLIRG